MSAKASLDLHDIFIVYSRHVEVVVKLDRPVISTEPEDEAMNRIRQLAKELNIDHPKLIGWDFPYLSQEQINVYHMHGYTAALVLPNGIEINKKRLLWRKERLRIM